MGKWPNCISSLLTQRTSTYNQNQNQNQLYWPSMHTYKEFDSGRESDLWCYSDIHTLNEKVKVLARHTGGLRTEPRTNPEPTLTTSLLYTPVLHGPVSACPHQARPIRPSKPLRVGQYKVAMFVSLSARGPGMVGILRLSPVWCVCVSGMQLCPWPLFPSPGRSRANAMVANRNLSHRFFNIEAVMTPWHNARDKESKW